MKLKHILLASALAVSTLVAGCTPAQEAAVIASVQTTCLLLPAGTTIGIEVLSSLVPGAAPVAAFSQPIGAAAAAACTTVVAQLQNIISGITSIGGTATVTVTTTPPVKSGLKKSTQRIVVPPASSTQTYVVQPFL